MIALHSHVRAGVTREPGIVVGRVTARGSTTYMIRFADYRIRSFDARYVEVQVVRLPARLRLVVNNEERA